MLLLGAPIFVVMGGLALMLLSTDALPLASLSLSHYQITVNPSLPALPLFTLAGLLFASTRASERLSLVFIQLFGQGRYATVMCVSVLCSCFTALTGGSGVTILALGGLLLPLLVRDGYTPLKGIGLVTSASALGVLLPPSVPLIMFAIMARVPINTMFLAGLLPALIMVLSLMVFGGFLKPGANRKDTANTSEVQAQTIPQESILQPSGNVWQALYQAKWEALAPVVAIGFLISGLTTPMESAALTAIYAILTQSLAHRELTAQKLFLCLSETAQLIGAVMLIMGMALGITNYLIDQGIPDLAIEWVQSITQNKFLFLFALNLFLLFAGAMMEIYAAIVVLVPLLLPLAQSYGIDSVHFGIIFLANLEIGFLCPPAGMNVYFASAVFKQPLSLVIKSVVPAAFAIFLGTLLVSWLPPLALTIPELFKSIP
jgi:tripartite ATP-independent transporter DctM subunit